MTLAIAILMKDPAEAKTRLRPALGDDAREKIALVLFENTLAFFKRAYPGVRLGIVTQSPRIIDFARLAGAEVILDDGVGGINSAASHAAQWANGIAATSLLIVHADIPTLADAEFAVLIEAGGSHSVVIGASRDGGTNALLVSPPAAIDFRFGPQSAAAHEAAAEAAGLSCSRLELDYLSRDLDTPDDLSRLSGSLRSPHNRPSSSGLTRGSAIASRLLIPGKSPPAVDPRVKPEDDGRRTGFTFQSFAIPGIPEVQPGDSLPDLIANALEDLGEQLLPGDILVIAQKIVSKSEGRMAPLAGFAPSPEALRIGEDIGKDPRKVEAILSESIDVLRAKRIGPDGLMITRHRQGWVCANAGIDESNLGEGKEGMLLLLPEDSDRSARLIRAWLEQRFGEPIGVIIADTFGRPWRQGLVNIAIGVAGAPAIVDWIGRRDAYGRLLKATQPAFADEVAAAAGLLMGKDANTPVVVVRGLRWQDQPDASALDVLRPIEQELFL